MGLILSSGSNSSESYCINLILYRRKANLKMKPHIISALILACLIVASCKSTNSDESAKGVIWLTTLGQEAKLEKLEGRISTGDSSSGNPVIQVNTSETFQTIDGFGYALTGGSADHLMGMENDARSELLNELYGTEKGEIGLSYVRVSIGASDLNAEVYSYNDLPSGQTDTDMSEFSLGKDHESVIPVLKEILAINPDIKIMGSPWSPPVWMKRFDIPVENGRDPDLPPTVGGALKTEYHDAYALYFVKYIQAMAEEGITIDAITVQNEPLHHRNNPSLHMDASQQRDFIKNSLGPAFEDAGIETKIIVWDHNADNPNYPISILNDPEAKQYIDGSGFHLYGGEITALNTVKNAHPDKNLYFTEQYQNSNGSFGPDLSWNIQQLIIGATRNWAKVVLHWNLTNNPALTPYTPYGGCGVCQGAVTINGSAVTRNVGYYITAHASKFVRPGSVRIASKQMQDLPNVAFKTEDGNVVIIMMNTTDSNQVFDISVDGDLYNTSLRPGSVATIIL